MSQREFLRYVSLACAPLLVWLLHFAALYIAASSVPATAACAPSTLRWGIWAITAIAVLAVVLLARRAVTWSAPRGRELRLVQIASVANAIIAITAIAWPAAAVLMQARWCQP